MKRWTTYNNKGFSLVELIIVIAILAIFIAILAPMFLTYVERSRVAVDADSVGVMARALKAVAADAAIDAEAEEFELIWHTGTDGSITVETMPVDISKYQDTIHELVGAVITPKSRVLSADPGTHITIKVEDTGTGTAGAAIIGAIAIPTGDAATYFQQLINGIN